MYVGIKPFHYAPPHSGFGQYAFGQQQHSSSGRLPSRSIVTDAAGYSFDPAVPGLSWRSLPPQPCTTFGNKQQQRTEWTDADRLARVKQQQNRIEDAERRKRVLRIKRESDARELHSRREQWRNTCERLGLPSRPPRKLDETAIHEAGHAFIAAWHGVTIHEVSIVERASELGYVSHAGVAKPMTDLHILVAGPIAEGILTRREWRPWAFGTDWMDCALILDLGVSDEDIAAASQSVEQILRANWATVVEIAQLLMDRHVLDGDFITRLVERRLNRAAA